MWRLYSRFNKELLKVRITQIPVSVAASLLPHPFTLMGRGHRPVICNVSSSEVLAAISSRNPISTSFFDYALVTFPFPSTISGKHLSLELVKLSFLVKTNHL